MRKAQAGTLESDDIHITIAEAVPGSGVQIDLTSIVLPQYGPAIKQVLLETAQHYGISDLVISAADKGALSCTIEARLITALTRAGILSEEEGLS